jgi:hypothetical protein
MKSDLKKGKIITLVAFREYDLKTLWPKSFKQIKDWGTFHSAQAPAQNHDECPVPSR